MGICLVLVEPRSGFAGLEGLADTLNPPMAMGKAGLDDLEEVLEEGAGGLIATQGV